MSSAEEEQYLKDTSYFAVLRDEGSVKKIRQDVEDGRWSPLEEQAEFSEFLGAVTVEKTWERLVSER